MSENKEQSGGGLWGGITGAAGGVAKGAGGVVGGTLNTVGDTVGVVGMYTLEVHFRKGRLVWDYSMLLLLCKIVLTPSSSRQRSR